MSEEKNITTMSYEERMTELNALLGRLDKSETPIDQLAADTKRGVTLINSMKTDLRKVEQDVLDAFADLDGPVDSDD